MAGTFEIVLVNDASPDDTWQVIAALAAAHPAVRGLDLLANVGQFRATICGLEHARGDLVVTLDDDLQHRPEDVPVLLGRLRDDPNVDCVVAAFPSKRQSVVRNLGSRVYHRIEGALYGARPGFRTSAFRAMRRSVAEAICAHRTARPVLAPLLLASARRIVNVEVTHEPRRRGRSGYRLRDLGGIARDTVFAGSTAPLRALTLLGLGAAVGSATLMTWYFGRWLTGRIGVPGFTTEVLLIAFFGGCTLLAIGLLGEYVARILAEVTGAPRWALRGATFETHTQRPSLARVARRERDERGRR
jgi:dolichol-phosphate mannosyltransferase/undecaprenyl-phosphate 4-deoxy-4-formamido-L-arabinose transferase